MEQPKRGAHGDASGENLLAWIQSPTALQGADHFARRASLEAEEGELVLRSRPDSGGSARVVEQANSEGQRTTLHGNTGSNESISLVLGARRRSATMRPHQAGSSASPSNDAHGFHDSMEVLSHTKSPEIDDDMLLRPVSKHGTRGNLDAVVRPLSATGMRPLSGTRAGRFRANTSQIDQSSLLAGNKPSIEASVGEVRVSTAGSLHGSGARRVTGVFNGHGIYNGQDEPENYLIDSDAEGESSPDMVSPYNRSKSSGSPAQSIAENDDFAFSREGVFSRNSRQERLLAESGELYAILDEGRQLSRKSGAKRRSVSPRALRPLRRMTPEEQTPDPGSSDSSPLALGSAPVCRPQPPTSGSPSDMTIRTERGMVRLPPVRKHSPSMSLTPTNTQASPLTLGSAPMEREGERFRKAVKQVQAANRLKAAEKPTKKKVVSLKREDDFSPARLSSPRPATRSNAPVSKKLSAAAGHQGTSPLRSGGQRLSSPIHPWRPSDGESPMSKASGGDSPTNTKRNAKASGGDSPIGLKRNVSQNGLSSPLGGRAAYSHGVFDTTRACLYVTQRSNRTSVLSKATDVRGIYRSIQQALNHAVDGDTIQVLSGVYEENLVIETSVFIKPCPGEEVTLRGQVGPTVKSTAKSFKLEGVTIEHTGGDSTLRGRDGVRCIEVQYGDLELVNSDISSSIGSGIILLNHGSLKVKKSRLTDCGRCGILCFDEGRIHCEDSIIKDNGLNGVDLQTGSTATLTRCKVLGNGQTGVLVSDADTHVTAFDCSFSANLRRGITAQHHGAFTLRNCTVAKNQDLGVLIMGDHSPCGCLLLNCIIKDNSEGALTIHGSVPDTSTCTVEGEVSLVNTPVRPSPSQVARQFAAASTIQSAWLCHAARQTVRRQIQIYLKGLAQKAALAEEERRRQLNSPRQGSPDSPMRSKSPVRTSSPRSPNSAEDDNSLEESERFEGMAALEADVIDTFNRFGNLGAAMDNLLAEASKPDDPETPGEGASG